MANITLNEQNAWAGSLIDSLGDSSTSTGYVAAWLQSNLGLLNSHIGTSFSVNNQGEIESHMLPSQSGLYNEMYFCHWIKRQSRSLLNNADYDWIEMRGEKQGSIKVVSRNERAKTSHLMAKDCDLNLRQIIKDLKGGSFLVPKSLSFNERFSTPEHIRCRDYHGWSEWNPIVTQPVSEIEGNVIYFSGYEPL